MKSFKDFLKYVKENQAPSQDMPVPSESSSEQKKEILQSYEELVSYGKCTSTEAINTISRKFGMPFSTVYELIETEGMLTEEIFKIQMPGKEAFTEICDGIGNCSECGAEKVPVDKHVCTTPISEINKLPRKGSLKWIDAEERKNNLHRLPSNEEVLKAYIYMKNPLPSMEKDSSEQRHILSVYSKMLLDNKFINRTESFKFFYIDALEFLDNLFKDKKLEDLKPEMMPKLEFMNESSISENSIQKKVEEINMLISKAKDSDGDEIGVIDNTSTWQAEMYFKPIVYKNGSLWIEYREYPEMKVKKERISKQNMELDGVPYLNDIMRWYKKALKKNGVSLNEKLSEDAQDFISKKIKYLIDEEGRPQRQAVAMAYSYAKKKGFKIPSKKKEIKKNEENMVTNVEDFKKMNESLDSSKIAKKIMAFVDRSYPEGFTVKDLEKVSDFYNDNYKKLGREKFFQKMPEASKAADSKKTFMEEIMLRVPELKKFKINKIIEDIYMDYWFGDRENQSESIKKIEKALT